MYDCPLISFMLWERNCREAEWYKIISSWTYRYDNTINIALKNITDGESVLDVGCSLGVISILAKLNLRKSNVKAVDISRTQIIEFLHYFPEIVVSFDIDDIYNLESKADWIICTEVLEHLDNDVQALKNIHANANKGLIISAPNETIREDIAGHKRRYNKETFTKLLETVGDFEIIDSPMNRHHNFGIVRKK